MACIIRVSKEVQRALLGDSSRSTYSNGIAHQHLPTPITFHPRHVLRTWCYIYCVEQLPDADQTTEHEGQLALNPLGAWCIAKSKRHWSFCRSLCHFDLNESQPGASGEDDLLTAVALLDTHSIRFSRNCPISSYVDAFEPFQYSPQNGTFW